MVAHDPMMADHNERKGKTMRITEEAIERVSKTLLGMKRENPANNIAVGIVCLELTENGKVMGDGEVICRLEELGRFCDELQMLREAVKQELGIY